VDRETARRKFDALSRMTEARGCTKDEAATAARLAKGLADKFGFAAQERRQRFRAWSQPCPNCGRLRCDCTDSERMMAGASQARTRAAQERADAEARRREAHKADWERRQREAKERERRREREEQAEYARREQDAAKRFGWEYRSCGKPKCHCMKEGTKHGPYKYRKVRVGKTVKSIYGGK
jgi:hypothetical protein